ncbi:7SK snRNA methylphosphate capping enzyme [Dissostichus eleginoides]|uniref:7SK snRNA methylphosphate capping enzyme n=2 Tax=Nototheniidae TaxID=8206 RepID=A0AAD9B5N4_DISEL|nr:7SK snRNA methylphosphate capping enzyme [Dissostichus eleginoides]
MIRMSLDTETVLPHEVSPAAVSLSEQSQLAKSRPLHAKNGLQLPGNSHPAPAGAQRIAKRRYSMGVGFKGLAKRRRRANSDSQSESVLPSNFLLGGNIFDPLNLNSLLDEDVNRATNQETPKCSPLPLRGGDPVEILVPRDITDP